MEEKESRFVWDIRRGGWVVSLGPVKADTTRKISSGLDDGSIKSKGSVSRAIGEMGDLRSRLALCGTSQVERIRTKWSDCGNSMEKCD